MGGMLIELEDPDGFVDLEDLVLEAESEEAEPPELAPAYGIPTVDHEDVEGCFVPYLHYRPEDTKVVSGPVGPVKKYPGTRFPSLKAARAHWVERAGRIIEDLSVDGRWIFRVARDA